MNLQDHINFLLEHAPPNILYRVKKEILKERNMRVNELANLSGITPSTVYSMMDERRKEITINVIKKLCDGLDMTLGEFFSSPIFDELEQEIR